MGTIFGIVIACLAVHQLIVGDGKPRKSPAAYRRERQFRQAQNAARRYEALPPMIKVINLAARRKKMRRSAVAAVRWAIGEDFATSEIDGSIIKVLHKRPELVEDQDALYRECLTVLWQATCQ